MPSTPTLYVYGVAVGFDCEAEHVIAVDRLDGEATVRVFEDVPLTGHDYEALASHDVEWLASDAIVLDKPVPTVGSRVVVSGDSLVVEATSRYGVTFRSIPVPLAEARAALGGAA